MITETLPAGIVLASVTTLPAGSLVSSNLATGTATVTVVAGAQTIVTFLDTAIPVVIATVIPTLSQWSLVAVSILTVLVAFGALWRRRRRAA